MNSACGRAPIRQSGPAVASSASLKTLMRPLVSVSAIAIGSVINSPPIHGLVEPSA